MSDLLIGADPDNIDAVTVLPETAEQKAKQLPDPSGYRILCGIPEIDDKFDSGLAKANQTMHYE